jgi:hypothetical protein
MAPPTLPPESADQLKRQDSAVAALHKAIAEIESAHGMSDGAMDFVVTRCLGERIVRRAHGQPEFALTLMLCQVKNGLNMVVRGLRASMQTKGTKH